MGFHEVRFPAALSFGSVGGPERRTEIVAIVNGYEERNTPWEHSRRHYDAGLSLRSLEDVEALVAFFEARRGQLHGFRWKDWSDWKSAGALAEITAFDQTLGAGDGKTTRFQLTKAYRSGAQSYVRPIRKPVEGTVRVAVDRDMKVPEQEFQVNHSTGEITFESAPPKGAVIHAGFEFDVPVRFDTDRILVSIASFQAGEVPDVPVVEVRI